MSEAVVLIPSYETAHERTKRAVRAIVSANEEMLAIIGVPLSPAEAADYRRRIRDHLSEVKTAILGDDDGPAEHPASPDSA